MSKDEFMDEELAGMVSHTDDTVPAEMPVMECKARLKAEVHSAPHKTEAVDAKYTPYHSAERSSFDKLRSCATWGGICGGISMLMWWFEVNGLMAMEAAYPCIVACALLAGFGVGRNMVK